MDRGPARSGGRRVSLPDVETLVARRAALVQRIRAAGGDPAAIEIVAVTKRFPPEAVALAVAAGFTSVGENYAQELVEKAAAVELGDDAPPVWHMIGGLQRNKIKRLARLTPGGEPSPTVARVVYQTIDRRELAAEVAARAPGATVYIQVNTTGESQKSGCAPEALDRLVDEVRTLDLDLAGLMTIGPTDGSDPTPSFELLRARADHHALRGCSMGMSGDIEAAVRAGSTMIRVGTALFGDRPTSL